MAKSKVHLPKGSGLGQRPTAWPVTPAQKTAVGILTLVGIILIAGLSILARGIDEAPALGDVGVSVC